jgi:hypothetical protein
VFGLQAGVRLGSSVLELLESNVLIRTFLKAPGLSGRKTKKGLPKPPNVGPKTPPESGEGRLKAECKAEPILQISRKRSPGTRHILVLAPLRIAREVSSFRNGTFSLANWKNPPKSPKLTAAMRTRQTSEVDTSPKVSLDGTKV